MGIKKITSLTGQVSRSWYKKGTDVKLVRVLLVDHGKRSWIWGEKDNDCYTEVASGDRELR